MIYEWRCKNCNCRREVERSIDDSSLPPDEEGHDWARVYSSSTPFNKLRDSGVFMDQYGNYPPRSMD